MARADVAVAVQHRLRIQDSIGGGQILNRCLSAACVSRVLPSCRFVGVLVGPAAFIFSLMPLDESHSKCLSGAHIVGRAFGI